MLDDNHITINNCTVCKNRMDCSRRFGIMMTVVSMGATSMHISVSCCEYPTITALAKAKDWKAAEIRLWDLIAHYNQYDPKGKANLKYLCALMTRCLIKRERSVGLYDEIFSYQEREG